MASNLPPGVTNAMIDEAAGDEPVRLQDLFKNQRPQVYLVQRVTIDVASGVPEVDRG